MNYKEFIEEYKKTQNTSNLVGKHIVATYIPFERKMSLSKKIINVSMYSNVNGNKVFIPNTPARYMCFVLAIIENYTDIRTFESNEPTVIGASNLKCFNLFEENGVIEKIVEAVGEDVTKFRTVLDMMVQDTIDQERNLVDFLDSKINAWQLGLDVLRKSLEEKNKSNDEL